MANSSRRASTASAIRCKHAARSATCILAQPLLWNASTAASTARSTSGFFKLVTVANLSPDPGLSTSKVSPSAASTHRPPTKDLCTDAARNCATAGGSWVSVVCSIEDVDIRKFLELKCGGILPHKTWDDTKCTESCATSNDRTVRAAGWEFQQTLRFEILGQIFANAY